MEPSREQGGARPVRAKSGDGAVPDLSKVVTPVASRHYPKASAATATGLLQPEEIAQLKELDREANKSYQQAEQRNADIFYSDIGDRIAAVKKEMTWRDRLAVRFSKKSGWSLLSRFLRKDSTIQFVATDVGRLKELQSLEEEKGSLYRKLQDENAKVDKIGDTAAGIVNKALLRSIESFEAKEGAEELWRRERKPEAMPQAAWDYLQIQKLENVSKSAETQLRKLVELWDVAFRANRRALSDKALDRTAANPIISQNAARTGKIANDAYSKLVDTMEEMGNRLGAERSLFTSALDNLKQIDIGKIQRWEKDDLRDGFLQSSSDLAGGLDWRAIKGMTDRFAMLGNVKKLEGRVRTAWQHEDTELRRLRAAKTEFITDLREKVQRGELQ